MIDKILKDIKGLFKVQDKAKFLKQNIPYLAFFYIGNIFSHHVRAYTGGYVIDKIFQGILEIDIMGFIPSIHFMDLIMGRLCGTYQVYRLYQGKKYKEVQIGERVWLGKMGNEKRYSAVHGGKVSKQYLIYSN